MTDPRDGDAIDGADHDRGPAREAAVDELLTRHLPDLRAYIRLRSGPRIRELESCSDLVQSVCREVLMSDGAPDFASDAAFRMWLLRVAENKIVDRHRYFGRGKRDVTRTVGGEGLEELAEAYARIHSPSQEASLREQVGRLEEAFDALPDDYREVILRAHVVGMPQKEIAEEMGRSVDAVRNLLFRALARLGRLLGERDRPAG